MSDLALDVAAEAVLDQLACRPTEKNLATARRVAAAVLVAVGQRQLIEACQDLVKECDAMQGPELRSDPTWAPLLEAADAALARAEGRQ